ncbi:MAG: hypothetical protein ACWA47_10030 [Brevirhabdus sp.]
MRQQIILLMASAALLSACSTLPFGAGTRPADQPFNSTETTDIRPIPRPDRDVKESGARVVDPVSSGLLGRTIGSLGDPSEPGLWAATPLVSVERAGRLELPGGKSVAVTLYPNGQEVGAGTQVSIGAMQALGVPLTELPELLVYGL